MGGTSTQLFQAATVSVAQVRDEAYRPEYTLLPSTFKSSLGNGLRLSVCLAAPLYIQRDRSLGAPGCDPVLGYECHATIHLESVAPRRDECLYIRALGRCRSFTTS